MIRNAVIPVAGIGTRLLPLTKSLPKEMLPVGRKPVIQHVVEELKAAGVVNVLLVTSRRKCAIENHFDSDHELAHVLAAAGKHELARELEIAETLGVNLLSIRQHEQLGLGHAIGCGESFTNGEPFVAALGDTIIRCADGCGITRRLVDCFEQTAAACVVALQEVPLDKVHLYGIARPAGGEDHGVFRLADLVEKPSSESAPSRLAIAARYVLSPAIFDAIRRTPPGKGGELQLTDAIRLLLREGAPVYGVRMEPGDRRFDIGSFDSYFKCFTEFALQDEECGPALREHLRRKLTGG